MYTLHGYELGLSHERDTDWLDTPLSAPERYPYFEGDLSSPLRGIPSTAHLGEWLMLPPEHPRSARRARSRDA